MTSPLPNLAWRTSAFTLRFALTDGPVRLTDIEPIGRTLRRRSDAPVARQPLVEIATTEWGQGGDESKLIDTPIGQRLRYRAHDETIADGHERLTIVQSEETTGLQVTSRLTVVAGTPAVRSTTTVTLLPGAASTRLLHVTSFATAAVISDDLAALDVWHGLSSPRAEGRWHVQALRTPGLATLDSHERGEYSWSGLQHTGVGARSTLAGPPAGVLVDRETGTAMAWQIEHNGGWTWEVGELADRARGIIAPEDRVRAPAAAGVMQGDSSHDGAYVVASGPTDPRHGWSVALTPGQSFTTVPATFTVARSRDEALADLGEHRRAARRSHPQNESLPIVFNDYMNTLVGDPTEDKLLPLIDAAASVGADYFCIDAGWYDDTAGWWASVGDWLPSTTRFPSGLGTVLQHVRDRGMVPGLWLEPEVIGVTSNAATQLPDDAFVTRDGQRVRVNDRFFLDLRQRAAREHIDDAVDRLIAEFGVGYFKFDYNITPGAGLDKDADSVGDGLLQLNRAVIDWLGAVLDRHPGLVIEGCSGGGGRTDFAMLREVQLVSTSDQENPLAYPAIAVGSLAHVLPEQAGNWAYPQADMTDREIAFSLAVGLAGRLYLAGVLNRMNDRQLELVRSAVTVHNATKHDIARSRPFFPLGLPDWNDSWVAVGFDGGGERPDHLIVWALPGATRHAFVPIPTGIIASVEQLYPIGAPVDDWTTSRDINGLQVTRPDHLPSAAMFRVQKERKSHG